VIAGLEELLPESDLRYTPRNLEGTPDRVRKRRFGFETFRDPPEVTRALREIDRIRKRGDPDCDPT